MGISRLLSSSSSQKKSVELTGKMLVLDDNNYDAHARMALYEYLEGRLPESRRHVKRCRNIDARHPCTIFDQAFYYILDRKYDKAAGRYKKLNQSEVDGLLAFEVSNFLLEEYLRKKEEIGFLFAAGYVNVKFVGHTELGLVQLKRFCKMAEGRSEYTEFYNIAKGALGNYASKVQ